MKFNFAYNKPNSFFRDKKATVNKDLVLNGNGLDDKIEKDTVITIYGKSTGSKVSFDIFTEDGIEMNRISHEYLEIIK